MALTYTVGFGKVSFATSGVSLSAFVVGPPYVRKLISKEHPLQHGTRTAEYPATGSRTNGALYGQNVCIPEGAIIQVQASRTYRGAKIADGALFFRTRDSAAFRQCAVRVPPAQGSNLGDSFVVFSGRFDVLSLEELNKLGIIPHAGMIKGFMNQEEIDELFTLVDVAPEATPAPEIITVTDTEGNETAVFTAPVPKRRVRIR